MGAKQAKLDVYYLRPSSSLGTPSTQSVHAYYPSAFEDGGRLAPLAINLFDRLSILVVVRCFPSMGAADSRSWRSEGYARMKDFVRRSTYVPLRRFLGNVRHEFMQRLIIIHDGFLSP
jgi:hypothetical protein